MSNNIAMATKMTGELDKAIVHKPVTGFMVDNNLRAKFVGAKTIMVPEISLSGLGNYNRETGYSKGAISVTRKPYELQQERSKSLNLDRMDNDESGVADLAGQIMGRFIKEKVVPEVDSYVLSKLAGLAATEKQVVNGAYATEALKILNEAIGAVQDYVGYDEELVAFVDKTMWGALQNTTELARYLTVNNFSKGEVDTQVKSYNGVSILPVPSSRMKSAYIFYDGESDGQEDGGHEPMAEAKNIGLLVLPKNAASLVKKTEDVRIFDPAHNLNMDAWKFDYRLYYDVLVMNSMKGGIYTYVY